MTDLVISEVVVAAKKLIRNSKKFSVMLEAEDRERLERLANKDQRSVGWYVRVAIEEYLGRHGSASGNP